MNGHAHGRFSKMSDDDMATVSSLVLDFSALFGIPLFLWTATN
jgi:hypothetical protein